MSRKKKLTVKQQRFVDAYTGPAKGNGTESARMAGYKGSESTLGTVSGENLKKPAILAAIDSALATEQHSAKDIRTEIIELMLAEARGETFDSAVVDNCVVDVPVKSSTRIAAQSQLAKIYRLSDERLQITIQGSLDGFLDSLEERLAPEVYDKVIDVLEELDGTE